MENLGLRVESSNPGKYATEVSIGSEVTIKFNSELNTRTIPGSVFVLKDTKRSYKDSVGIINMDLYEIVEGSVSYKDKTINFKPSNQLDVRARYIIYVKKDTLSDILGKGMLIDYISYFDTTDYEINRRCDVLSPNSNEILESLNKVVVEDLGDVNYIIQISKQPTFETVIFEKMFDTNDIDLNSDILVLSDGVYYVRARVENSNFGDAVVFSVKSYVQTTTTDQDIDEDYVYAPFQDPELELLGSFPESGAVNVNVKTNTMYMKFNKLIPLNTIDFYEAEIYGKFLDEDDQFNDKSVVEHGNLDGTFSVIYDDVNKETYIFFTPTSM